MKIDCLWCGHEINLNHRIFDNYRGQVKCFSCSSMIDLITENGSMVSAALMQYEAEEYSQGIPEPIIAQVAAKGDFCIG